MESNLLSLAAQEWMQLTDYIYAFTYGYKNKLYDVNLTFSIEDFPHLAGFQYLKDIVIPRYNATKVIERILDGTININQINKSGQFKQMIEPRLNALVHLKETFVTIYVVLRLNRLREIMKQIRENFLY